MFLAEKVKYTQHEMTLQTKRSYNLFTGPEALFFHFLAQPWSEF